MLAQPFSMGDRISSFLSYDCIVDFAVADGCHYEAHIVGTLSPVYSRPERGEEVEPHLNISATLVCPSKPPAHIEQSLEHTGPISRERVEALIGQYGAITQERENRRCVHVPTFRFRGESIVGVGIESYCSRPNS